MKKFKQTFFDFFKETQKDEIKGCLDIIFRNHTTEQSLHIFNETKKVFDAELTRRFNDNLKENQMIKTYFKPSKNESCVKDDIFQKPITIVDFNNVNN